MARAICDLPVLSDGAERDCVDAPLLAMTAFYWHWKRSQAIAQSVIRRICSAAVPDQAAESNRAPSDAKEPCSGPSARRGADSVRHPPLPTAILTGGAEGAAS